MSLAILAALVCCASPSHARVPERAAPAIIGANDNRRPAGTLRNGVLTVSLEARLGAWYPEGPNGTELTTAAFGEPGRPLQNPGPLIRVPVGTVVRATLRNALAEPMTVFGFGLARRRRQRRDRAGRDARAPRSPRPRAAPFTTPAKTIRRAHSRPRAPTARSSTARSSWIPRAPAACRPRLPDLVVVHARFDEPTGVGPRDDGDQWTVVAAHRTPRPGAGRLRAVAR